MARRTDCNRHRAVAVLAAMSTLAACTSLNPAPPVAPTDASRAVAFQPSRALAPDGRSIAWIEHIIDAEDVNGGEPIRGGDGIAIADLDRDGHADIITAQEDSSHLRVAFGSADPDRWTLVSIAEGSVVGAIEDVAVGDLDGDGWPDIVAACEEAHLAYFQNPGASANPRKASWPSTIPVMSSGRGSWLRVFIADINGDGRPDLTAANKGAPDIIRPGIDGPANGTTSLITLSGPPLDPTAWQEQVLYDTGVPNTALPFDFDGDGDLDVLAAQRVAQRLVLIENLGSSAEGTLAHRAIHLTLQPAVPTSGDWAGLANAFQAETADLDGDGRTDIILNVIERSPALSGMQAGLAWLRQPEMPTEPWTVHRIGHTLPDWVIGIHLADIDGDGDLDAVTGGYSGLNILDGSYSGASREHDTPGVDAAASVARIAWFENPGDPTARWTRHDISRRVRGMYDMFASRDMDGDGDLDLIAPRGNSGTYDGVFWLEQVRSETPAPALTPARSEESRHLPLPPDDWLERYQRAVTYVAPNKAGE